MARQGGLVGRLRPAATQLARAVAGTTVATVQKDQPPGVNAGWATPWGAFRRGTRPLQDLMSTYGGTDESVTWVFACVTWRAEQLAGLEWELLKPGSKPGDERPVDRTRATEDLYSLIEEPNDYQTYFDWANAVATDVDLVGNSYWLKDNRNGMFQPLALERMPPDRTRIATDAQDRKIGYVLDVNGRQIAYNLDEVIHYRYPNPLNRHYGMGIVEALIRAVSAEVAESQHIIGFFQNGARISGVLSTADTLNPETFDRIREQFSEEFGGAANAYKTLIAEQGLDYKPMSQPPAALGVVDLRKLSKDEILSGFGVSEFLLGGASQAGQYKMGEARAIAYQRLAPLARRFSERTTLDLTSLWGGVKFRAQIDSGETPADRALRARSLVGTGLTADELRDVAGEAKLEIVGVTDVPLVPNTLITITELTTIVEEPAFPEGEDPEDDDPNEGDPGELPDTPPAEPDNPGDDPGLDPNDPVDNSRSVRGMFDTFTGHNLKTLPPAGQNGPLDELESTVRRALKAADSFDAPALPAGFEKRAGTVSVSHAVPQAAHQILMGQAAVYSQFTPELATMMRAFFAKQRARTVDRLAEYGPSGKNAKGGRLKAAPKYARKDLTPASVWDDDAENEALVTAYMPVADDIAKATMPHVAAATGGDPQWTLTNPLVDAQREKLAKLVTRVNDTTRQAVADTVSVGIDRAYSVTQIANGVADEGYQGLLGLFDQFNAARAETVARTETAMAFNAASAAGYGQAGVESVEILDGDDCGWTEHDDPDLADGTVRSVDDFDEYPISHPNCVRAGAPIVPGDSDSVDDA